MRIINYLHINKATISILICSILYLFFAYNLEREQFLLLTSIYSILFISFIGLTQFKVLSFKQLAYIAFGFRAIFIIAIPNLSQDFYRFIWDGRLILEGLNPYLQTPNTIIDSSIIKIAESQELYTNMGELSAMHFSNYPPINQFFFFIAALFSSKNILGSVIILRLIIIAADFGVLYFGKRILDLLKVNSKQVFWYILNPFIIIELTGNLHFEGVMIFFLVASLFYLFKNKWVLSALFLGCSISVKLIPLLFLPIFFWWFLRKNKKKTSFLKKSKNLKIQRTNWSLNLLKLIGFYGVTFIFVFLSFIPFISRELIPKYSKTIGLWFGNFEFNASVYYLFREIGYLFRGYNEIQIIGKITPVLIIITTLIIAFFRKNQQPKTLIISLLLVLTSYLFTSTTVHPWYIATLLILSVFSNYKYIFVWSFTIILSYYAYSQTNFKESALLLFLQYIPVYICFIWEMFLKKSTAEILKSTKN